MHSYCIHCSCDCCWDGGGGRGHSAGRSGEGEGMREREKNYYKNGQRKQGIKIILQRTISVLHIFLNQQDICLGTNQRWPKSDDTMPRV